MNRHFIVQYLVSKKLTKYMARVYFNDIQLAEIYSDNLETLKHEVRFFCSSINNSNLNQLIKYAED